MKTAQIGPFQSSSTLGRWKKSQKDSTTYFVPWVIYSLDGRRNQKLCDMVPGQYIVFLAGMFNTTCIITPLTSPPKKTGTTFNGDAESHTFKQF